jgi:hypothetical protein
VIGDCRARRRARQVDAALIV